MNLADALQAAAAGRFPPVDGGWSRSEPWRDGVEAAIAFTGHAVMAVGPDVSDHDLEELGVDGYGGAHHPRAIAALAGRGSIGVLDALLIGRGTGGKVSVLVPRDDLRTLPRAQHALALREDVQVLGTPDTAEATVVTLARGLAGLAELSLELDPNCPSMSGAALLDAALTHLPEGELVVACVSPGNARSLRLFLRTGFTPVGSVQLWQPERATETVS